MKNVTGTDQEVTFPDGKGGTVTKTVEVPIPMVGSLTTVAPPNFTDVKSKQANLAGDGKGGTKLSFTMTLFPPIGSDTAEFGYTANITDGIVPESAISALPVNPLESPTFASAATSYQGGADTGIELTDGATQIDANLLKLRDGAGDLLAGLIKLRNGAQGLEAGLAGEASPGANQLADGANELNDGLNRIDDGAGQLADSAGAASDGSRKLTDGLGQISGGLDQLADSQTGLPKAESGIKQLKAGVDQILGGFGTPGQEGTLIDGLSRLEVGLGKLRDGSGTLAGGLGQLRGDAGNPLDPTDGSGLAKAKDAVGAVKFGLDESLKTGGSLDQLAGGLNFVKTTDCGPVCQGFIDSRILPGVATSRTNLQQASGGLGLVQAGLGDAVNALDAQLVPGAQSINAGLVEAAGGATKAKDGARQLKGGVQQVRGGLVQLQDGIGAAVAGVLKLSDGAGEAHSGGSALTDGLTQLDDGANTLSDGTGTAADGSGRLADGADKLADGLGDAADGSGKIAGGLETAADGAPKLEDGAQRLSDEGTKKLIEAGDGTAQTYGELYATIEAGADRASTEKMAFGAPEGAAGLTAYSYEIKGEDGEGGRNLARGLGGLAILGAGAAAFGIRRGMI